MKAHCRRCDCSDWGSKLMDGKRNRVWGPPSADRHPQQLAACIDHMISKLLLIAMHLVNALSWNVANTSLRDLRNS